MYKAPSGPKGDSRRNYALNNVSVVDYFKRGSFGFELEGNDFGASRGGSKMRTEKIVVPFITESCARIIGKARRPIIRQSQWGKQIRRLSGKMGNVEFFRLSKPYILHWVGRICQIAS